MFYNYFKLAFRNFKKNRTFVLINILGLGIAIACSIVAFLNHQYNAEFDSQHKNAEQIYRVNFVRVMNGISKGNGMCPSPLAQIIDNSFAQVEEVTRLRHAMGSNFKVEDQVFASDVTLVDPAFFKMFSFSFLYGEPSAINDKRSIFISSELNDKYFNGANSTGQTLTYLDQSGTTDFKIGGVFEKPPMNSSFWAEAFVHFENVFDFYQLSHDDWSDFNTTFVTIPDPENVPIVTEQLQAYVQIQNKAKQDYKVDHYYLDPFKGMAVRAEKEDLLNHWMQSSLPPAAAVAPGIMALLILLIACFNFTNTSIAIANRRIKEIGIRKVMGSNRKQIALQFFGENMVLTFLALITGVAIASYIVPAYSAMWAFMEIKLDLLKDVKLWSFLILLLLCTGVVAGLYPSIYVSRFHPSAIFRGSTKFSGTNLLTRILLTLQFAISLIAIIAGLVFNQNARFQKEYDLGFKAESVVSAYVPDYQHFNRLKNAMAGHPKVKEIAGSRHSIVRSWYNDPIKVDTRELGVSIMDIGPGYLSVIGATLLKGRDFREESQQDIQESAIINQKLARVLNLDNPLGQRIMMKDTSYVTVIGVVKDIYFDGGLWEPLEPLLLRPAAKSSYRYISVQAETEDIVLVRAAMERNWNKLFPDRLSTIFLLEEEKVNSEEVNSNIKVLFLFLGGVATLLSIFGLYSLLSLNLNKKMKELGVRKILGASTGQLAFRAVKEFFVIISISSILGSVAGYYMSNILMDSIWTYYIDIQSWIIIISVIILFVMSLLSIGSKVYKATTTAPAIVIKEI